MSKNNKDLLKLFETFNKNPPKDRKLTEKELELEII